MPDPRIPVVLRPTFALVFAAGALLSPAPAAEPDSDALPPHALARMGTTRFRHAGVLLGLAYTPDGKTLVSASHDHTLIVWDLASGKPRRHLEGHALGVRSLALSGDGKVVVSASEDETIRFWDAASGQSMRQVSLGRRWFTPVALSRDGKTLAFTGADNAVRLLEVASGRERARFGGRQGIVFSLAFTPDMRALVSGHADTTVLIWDVAGAAGRPGDLSPKELDALWGELSGDDASAAFRAGWALTRSPRQAVALLKERVRPGAGPDAAEVARLIAELDSDEFEVRQKATKELARHGRAVEGALKKALAAASSEESRVRLKRLLDGAGWPTASGEMLAALRAVEVLERVGTPEAREVLDGLAKGEPGSWVAQEARAALGRMGQ
jgi:hypothetical protein